MGYLPTVALQPGIRLPLTGLSEGRQTDKCRDTDPPIFLLACPNFLQLTFQTEALYAMFPAREEPTYALFSSNLNSRAREQPHSLLRNLWQTHGEQTPQTGLPSWQPPAQLMGRNPGGNVTI